MPIVAEDKDVVVIGGGDTGMDCISNANREGARSTLLLDVYPEVPEDGRYPDTPWPLPLKRSATTYALDEGGERRFGHQVIELRGDADGNVAELVGRKVTGSSSRTLEPVEGSEYTLPAQLVLVAVGFTGPEREGLLDGLAVELDWPRQRPRPRLRIEPERNLRRGRRPGRPIPDRHRDSRRPPLRPSSRPLLEGRRPRHSGRFAHHTLVVHAQIQAILRIFPKLSACNKPAHSVWCPFPSAPPLPPAH